MYRPLLPRNVSTTQPLPSFNQKNNLLKCEPIYVPSPQQTNELARLWCVSPAMVTQYFQSQTAKGVMKEVGVSHDPYMMDAVIALLSLNSDI
jgi:hypothetical protein